MSQFRPEKEESCILVLCKGGQEHQKRNKEKQEEVGAKYNILIKIKKGVEVSVLIFLFLLPFQRRLLSACSLLTKTSTQTRWKKWWGSYYILWIHKDKTLALPFIYKKVHSSFHSPLFLLPPFDTYANVSVCVSRIFRRRAKI